MDEQTLAMSHGEHLPHWTCKGAVYHVVFRLADSVPQSKLALWTNDRTRAAPEDQTAETPRDARYRKSEEIDTWLDSGHGACHLRQPEIAGIVADALKHFDGERYRLHAWCVMPNHVHVIVEPLGDYQLSKLIHSWKSFTANAINRRLGLSGTLWQADAYNHIIRTQKEYDYQVRYVWENPDKANIPDWPWRWAADQDSAAHSEVSPSDCVVRASSPDNPECRLSASSSVQSGQDGLTTQLHTQSWTPAAGRFDGWPETLADFKLLDPCCGSGHFLVAAFLLLVPMRMAAEGLSAREAVDAVLRDNLHGLEIDPRCVEIAVFALALAAWRFPDENGDPLGVRPEMPAPNIACCGLKVAARPEDWEALVPFESGQDGLTTQAQSSCVVRASSPDETPRAAHLREGLRRLHDTFRQAPLLGSLLDPGRAHEGDLFAPDYAALRGLLREALSTESSSGSRSEADSLWDYAFSAQGLLEAAQLLEARYYLVVTNVPYLARGKQSDALKSYCEKHYPEAKNDLANVFLERCLELCVDAPSSREKTRQDGPSTGVVQIVMPQNWLFLTSYRKQRERLLKRVSWNLLGRLGPGAFETISGEIVQAILLTQTHALAAEGFELRGVDASAPKSAAEKAALLREGELVAVGQKGQLGNIDSRVALDEAIKSDLLSAYVNAHQGLATGDLPRFGRSIWEIPDVGLMSEWVPWQGSVLETVEYSGRSMALHWQSGRGSLHKFNEAAKATRKNTHLRGIHCIGKRGVVVTQMRTLPVAIYTGERYDDNTTVLLPKADDYLGAVWAFCSSPEYAEQVRRIDSALKVPANTLAKVPFDLPHWQQVAAERYPNGLPKPYSDDPTQWLFHGHPRPATDPLHVAVARLLGYRWPAETDAEMDLADEARAWIARCEALADHVDDDGIVCLPSVRGEPPAADRLLALLIAAWETVEPGSWKPSILDKLLADAGCAGKGLDVWLRDSFFEQHAKRFHHRPFIWHVWDGLKDGFGALVNYHKLDARNLERLIHTYLGDWIRQQEAGVRDGVDGAPIRLAAAQALKRRLELILEGEAPYDIFVRWKPLAEQPIGWNPDLNDGVRLNIRPFMTAEILRHNKKPKLNIKWDKDRGKDVESAPWFSVFKGERINDHHLTLAEKQGARRRA
jgi:REP element-mobilizing transposase RayT